MAISSSSMCIKFRPLGARTLRVSRTLSEPYCAVGRCIRMAIAFGSAVRATRGLSSMTPWSWVGMPLDRSTHRIAMSSSHVPLPSYQKSSEASLLAPPRLLLAGRGAQRFLSGGLDNTVRVWRLNGTLENTFELHTHNVTALVALPDNEHALSGSSDRTVKLFNVNNGAVLRTFRHLTAPLALLPDGLRFISGSYDKTACIVEHGLAPQ